MNCYYHTDKKAVIQCKKCSKGLCSDCSQLFKSNLCMDCEKEDATKSMVKSIILLLSGLVIPVLLYFLFDNASFFGKDFNEFVTISKDVSKGLLEFPNIVSAEIGNENIIIPEELINKLALYLLVYVFSSIPFGWYLLNRLSSHSLSGSIIVLIIIVVIKFEISCIIGPIVMPIAIIVSIASIVKSRKRLSEVAIQENKHFAYVFSKSTELKIPEEITE